MGNGPSMKPGSATTPAVTEERAKMPSLYDSGPGATAMTADAFMAKFAEFRAGHVSGKVELIPKNA